PPRAGSRGRAGGEAVGEVTSGNYSPVLGHGIALAFLPPSFEAGVEVAVEVRGQELAARIVPTPFVGRRRA
ncbi:MAG TPA: glycine cleavage T C-terminal barrel domain-containing protein, partial [Acidimicrobiales bacterium]|nr:glycine cleavage T C-terminal barrel domain-containing protein [Acidimicrobiales bacterium]